MKCKVTFLKCPVIELGNETKRNETKTAYMCEVKLYGLTLNKNTKRISVKNFQHDDMEKKSDKNNFTMKENYRCQF